MGSEKRHKSEVDINSDDKTLEYLHHDMFDYLESEEWSAAHSLAQPSFLKQVDSRIVRRSKLAKFQQDLQERVF